MPQFSLGNPGTITQTVSGISEALFGAPNTDAQIQGHLDAQLANQRAANARLTSLEGDRQAMYNDSLGQLTEAIRTNPALFNTPEGMRLATSLAISAGQDPGDYVQALPGVATMIDPSIFTPQQQSDILHSTGVVTDFGNTQVGQQREIASDELGDVLAGQVDIRQEQIRQAAASERQAAEQAFELANPGLSSNGPGQFGAPLEVQRLNDTVTELLDMGGISGLDEESRLWAHQQAMELAQQPGQTAASAVSETLRILQEAERGIFGGILTDSLPQIGQPGLAQPNVPDPFGGLNSLGEGYEGEIRVSPTSGRAVMFTNGQWVEISQ